MKITSVYMDDKKRLFEETFIIFVCIPTDCYFKMIKSTIHFYNPVEIIGVPAIRELLQKFKDFNLSVLKLKKKDITYIFR